MKRLAIAVIAMATTVALSAPAYAQVAGPKIAIHIQVPAAKGACTTGAPNVACSTFNSQGDVTTPLNLYFIVADGPVGGIGGASFGLLYDSNLFAGAWNKCADQDFAGNGWPASGGGNAITWATCPTDDYGEGIQGVLGFLYVYAYAPTFLQITQRDFITDPVVKQITVASCSAAETQLDQTQTGIAKFSANGVDQGCNPCLSTCLPVPVEASTWGHIKSSFGTEN